MADPITGTDRRAADKTDASRHLQSGTLTAGSFDDNLDPEFFRAFARQVAQKANVGDLPGRLAGHRLLLSVRSTDDRPVGNAKVRVANADGAAVDLLTRTDGTCIFVSSWDQVAADGDLTVTVTPADSSATVSQKVPRTVTRWEIPLPAAAPLPRNLDLALVVDTTGSMGDELEYIKAEIKSIAAAVRERFPEVNQRYSLVVYRDQGDEYVTRKFDFTASLDEFRRNLGAQQAGGGGDTPEAVHRALEDASQLSWRDDHTARVLFLVADAPPHAQFVDRTMNAAAALRKKGVAIYPVAASGYDDAAELVMRGSAFVTGGQFLFLTDDSGVGNAHAEPHIPYFQVQRLDKLMVRMIASELSGKRIEPESGDVLRTVGRPTNTEGRKATAGK